MAPIKLVAPAERCHIEHHYRQYREEEAVGHGPIGIGIRPRNHKNSVRPSGSRE